MNGVEEKAAHKTRLSCYIKTKFDYIGEWKKEKSFSALTHNEKHKNVTQLEVMACKKKTLKGFT